MTWLCLFRVLALALTCKQASKLNKCPIYAGVLYFRIYVRMSPVCMCVRRVRCVAVRLRTCLLICIWENIDDECRIRRWMERSTSTACFLDIQSRAITIVILESFPIGSKFIFILSEVEISFSCISCCIFSRYVFDALNIVAYAVSVHEIDFSTKKIQRILHYDCIINIII